MAEQETIRLLISTMGAVVGSLAVAAAAIWAPLKVQQREHRRLEAVSVRDKLGDAIGELIDAAMNEQHAVEEAPRGGGTDAERQSVLHLNRAMSRLDLLLGGDTQPVSIWMRGFLVDRELQTDAENRRYFVFEGLRNLIDWHQGVLSVEELRPFKFETLRGSNRRVSLVSWQFDEAYDEGDRGHG